MKRQSLVSVVVPVLNGMKYLPDFLESYTRTSYLPRETIFIDDGSTDGTQLFIRNFYKKQNLGDHLVVIQNRKRKGIAGSRNIGIKKARGKYIAFVEVDMAFDKAWLTELVRACSKSTEIGGVNGKIMDFQNRKIITAAGVKLIPHTGWVIPIGLGEIDRRQYDRETPTLISAVGSLVPRKVLLEIKGFDALLNRNVEDIDLGWRISVAGYETLYIPKAVVYHHVAKNPQKRSDISSFKQQFNLSKNTRLVFKNYSVENVFRFFPIAIVANVGRVFNRVFAGDFLGSVGIIFSFFWFLVVFPDTIRQRRLISQYRAASDEVVMGNIMLEGSLLAIYSRYLKTKGASLKLSRSRNST